jgi:diguanylate cyclase
MKSKAKTIFTEDRESLDIILSIMQLCETLNLNAIIEFIEDKEQAELLRSVGCKYFQGYYYSKPLSEEELIQFIKKTSDFNSSLIQA